MFSMSRLLVAAVLSLAAISAPSARAADKEVFPAQPALAGTMLNGKPYKLDTGKGNIILVIFWATWCPTCQAEMPAFRKFYETNKKAGFELVAVSIDDAMSDIDEYAKILLQAKDHKVLENMKRESRIFASRYSWDTVAQQYERFILDIYDREKHE